MTQVTELSRFKAFLSYKADSNFGSHTSYSAYHKTFLCFLRSCLFLVLLHQFSSNLQSVPEEHNLTVFSNAGAILISTCGVRGTAYK